MKNIRKQSVNGGFTLVELLVICLLLSFLAALGFYIFRHFTRDGAAMARQQNIQSVAGDLMRHLRKDLRSATATSVASQSILIEIVQLNHEGIPEKIQVSYVFKKDSARRNSKKNKRLYNFSDFLQPTDSFLATIEKPDDGSGISLEMKVISNDSREIFQLKEHLSIANQQKAKN